MSIWTVTCRIKDICERLLPYILELFAAKRGGMARCQILVTTNRRWYLYPCQKHRVVYVEQMTAGRIHRHRKYILTPD